MRISLVSVRYIALPIQGPISKQCNYFVALTYASSSLLCYRSDEVSYDAETYVTATKYSLIANILHKYSTRRNDRPLMLTRAHVNN